MARNYNHLPRVAFSILMALSLRERHGYEIIQQIEEDSLGRIKLGAGALYTSIHSLHDHSLVKEVHKPHDKSRRYYKLTKSGRIVLNDELAYYKKMLVLAEQRHVFER